MSNRIITISREFGSGGRAIGQMAAEKLGLEWYDRDILDQLVKESGFSEETVAEQSEYAKGFFSTAFSKSRFDAETVQDRLWNEQKKIIRDLASKGSCVIIGRCADYILRDEYDCLRVFIHSDMETRKNRIQDLLGESTVATEKMLNDRDKRRENYYRLYTDIRWGDARDYDLTINSSKISLEKCVEMICNLYNA